MKTNWRIEKTQKHAANYKVIWQGYKADKKDAFIASESSYR